jgi:DNA-directed RNA polymerase subunit RPC12/RpoP
VAPNSDFSIEHQCPQCGAPILLKETDRLITCEYCRVTSYLMPRQFFRYRLPHKAPAGQRLVYIPYWRFRGMVFSCVAQEILQQFVDLSQLALNDDTVFPGSLGLRAQAMKLKFVTPETGGHFVQPDIALKQAMQRFEIRFNETKSGKPFFREYIGEATSLIYAPYYVSHKLYDAVLNQPHVSSPPPDFDAESLPGGAPEGSGITFKASLCPSCGWDMKGERDSQVLCCHNCQSIWQPTARQFVALSFGHISARTRRPVRFFPFWRIRAAVSGLELDTAADVIRLANLTRVAQPADHKRGVYFWAPAFKIRPRVLLRLASSLTLSQPETGPLQAQIPPRDLQAVNLPIMEAVESLKITLAGFIKPRRSLFPKLPQISIRPLGFKLVYIPFVEGHHDYIHPAWELAINKNMLKLSRNL